MFFCSISYRKNTKKQKSLYIVNVITELCLYADIEQGVKTIRTNEIGGGTEQSLWRGGGTEQSIKRKLIAFTVVACLAVTVIGVLGGGDMSLSVGGGDMSLSVGGGDMSLSVGGGDMSLSIGGGDMSLSIGGGDESW
jgi:hypothetical protein